MEPYSILIEGVGGIGGVVAGKLIQAGYRPTLVTGNPEISEAVNLDGIRVVTPEEKFTVPAKALRTWRSCSPQATNSLFKALGLTVRGKVIKISPLVFPTEFL